MCCCCCTPRPHHHLWECPCQVPFPRRFRTKEERREGLLQYKAELEKELKAVEELLSEL